MHSTRKITGMPSNITIKLNRTQVKGQATWFVKRIITFSAYPLLKKLGYLSLRSAPIDFPKSDYYSAATRWDHILGLHGLPYSRAWLDSKRENVSMKEGEFIPWITYPALEFLEKLPLHMWKVLEFGSGASTIWFQKRSKIFQSYEFDAAYLSKILKFIEPTYPDIIYASKFSDNSSHESLDQDLHNLLAEDRKLNDSDSNFLNDFNQEKFINLVLDDIKSADFIFIDGGPRNFLLGLSAREGKPDIVIVLDNSDMECFLPGIKTLKSLGFVEFPFLGPGPLNPYNWQTSIFIKTLASLREQLD
jgi:hypothetical protein